ncbi:replication initiation protein [Acinetobacter nectaris]|uniref:replication initiation protein n=1 Tax=Acinetobacter nectaris TaxID=1219382 RepID=UPI001F26B33A|nr:replication initiation protein [Acinetobacter nectaris]MCF9047428.1 replication initiation protein [Acinetobacter nectaris]
MNNIQFLEVFYKNLAPKPYCSYGKGTATFIRSKHHAIKFPLIQVNPPHIVRYLIFDIDMPDAYLHFSDAQLPVPTWIAKNKENGHCHICYELKIPVCKTENARLKPLAYLAAIEHSYANKLGADLEYAGLLTKNPIDRKNWEVTLLNPRPFELDELADYVDLDYQPKKMTKNEISGLGRNCAMFDSVRFWAYKEIGGSIDMGYKSWHSKVLNTAQSVNHTFLQPLPHSEVKATAASVAKWVWRNHHSAEFQAKFSEKQANRAKIGNTKGSNSKGGKARSLNYADSRQMALKLHIEGMNNTQIAAKLNVSRKSITRWLTGKIVI